MQHWEQVDDDDTVQQRICVGFDDYSSIDGDQNIAGSTVRSQHIIYASDACKISTPKHTQCVPSLTWCPQQHVVTLYSLRPVVFCHFMIESETHLVTFPPRWLEGHQCKHCLYTLQCAAPSPLKIAPSHGGSEPYLLAMSKLNIKVGHRKLWRVNGRTDRHAVWAVESGGLKEVCVMLRCTLAQPGKYDWTVLVRTDMFRYTMWDGINVTGGYCSSVSMCPCLACGVVSFCL